MGYWSGYLTYRRGPSKASPTHRQLIKGDRRAHIVDQVMALLKTWTSSPFEHEGTLRASIRSALCTAGHRWVLADLEAEAIVEEGLRRIGAVRPSWAEGQWTHTDSPDFCSWCRRPMDDQDRTPGQRFCSPHCARCAIESRDYKDTSKRDAIGWNAYRLIAKTSAPPRTCQHCGKSFRNDRREVLFCSRACVSASRVAPKDQTCLACGEAFHALQQGQECCSLSCRNRLRYTREVERMRDTVKTCGCCGAQFTPTMSRSLYCTPKCGQTMSNRAAYERQKAKRAARLVPPPLTAEVFDGWFAMAA